MGLTAGLLAPGEVQAQTFKGFGTTWDQVRCLRGRAEGGKGLGQVYLRVEDIAAPWSVPGDHPEPLVSDPSLSPETRMQALRKSKRLYV